MNSRNGDAKPALYNDRVYCGNAERFQRRPQQCREGMRRSRHHAGSLIRAGLCVLAVVLFGGAAVWGSGPVAANAIAERLLHEALNQAKQGHLDEAYLISKEAAAVGDDSDAVAARDLFRQRAVLAHLERAHGLEAAGRRADAAMEYRFAMAMDPANLDARQGLARAYPAMTTASPSASEMRVQRAAPPVVIQPIRGRHDFNFRGDLRQAVGTVAEAYGLRAYLSDGVANSPMHMDIAGASFAQAMTALHDMAGVDWIPLDAHTLYFTASEQLKEVAPVALRTFYLPWINDGIELNEIANVVRTLLAVREVTTDPTTSAISIRATPGQLDAAEKLLLDLHRSRGQVLLEIKILEINATAARDLGIAEPSQFTMFALGPLLAQLTQSGNLQQEILQLFEQGGLNAVLSSGQLSAAQLAQAQAALSPLLQNPFVVFGGGATLMAVSVPPFSVNASINESRVTSLETALMRSAGGQSAELKIGQRFPVINATFSPISLSPAIGQVIANGSFTQPFPSFTYEDLGLDAKITPWVAPNRDLHLQVELTVQALTGESNNNIPILTNRHLVSEVSLHDGEPVVLAGLLNRQEMMSLSGLPGLAELPGFGRLFSTENRQTSTDQLILAITPHVVQLPEESSAATWLPPGFAPAGNEEVPGAFPGRAGPGLVPATLGGRGGG